MSRESLTIRRISSIAGLRIVRGTGIQNDFARHVHGDLCIGMVTEGSRRMTISGQDHLFSAGDIFVVNPREPHSSVSVDGTPHSYTVLIVPEQVMEDVPQGYNLPGQRIIFNNIIRDDSSAIQKLRAACDEKDHAYTLPQPERIYSLLAYLAQHHSTCEPLPSPADSHNAVKKAKEYMDRNFRDDISLELLSEITGTSPYHLNRIFTEETGMSPHAYQVHMRIETSKRLLLAGYSIAHVSAESGFTDQSHFTKFFRKVTGTTPGRFVRCNTDMVY